MTRTQEADGTVALKVSEIFASIQGEGPSAGQPAAFLRLAGCNLRCEWCDTKYTWDWENYDYAREVARKSIAEVHDELMLLSPRRLVITGGEPLLQQPGLVSLLASLAKDWIVEIETNGTLLPEPALLARVNQWNVSPKLSHSRDPLERRLRADVLRSLAHQPNAWLKIVVQQHSDGQEILQVVTASGWAHERILLMPEAQSADQLVQREEIVAKLAQERGYGVSPRLHVAWWNGRRGV